MTFHWNIPSGSNTLYGPDLGPTPPGFSGAVQPPQAPWAMPMPGAFNNFWPPPSPFGLPLPAPIPNPIDHGFPGTQLKNWSGGYGIEPGYNYLYPPKHAKIHVFKTKTKPWAVNQTIMPNDDLQHVKLYVPITTTVKELMQGLGCCNGDAGKNILYECVEKGGGRWASGIVVKGDNKDEMKKSIEDKGWDHTRTGGFGKRPVTWLWATSDGK